MNQPLMETIHQVFAAISSLDSERFAATFTAEGVWEDPAGTPAKIGRQSIATGFAQLAGLLSTLEMRAEQAFIVGNQAAILWSAQGRAKNGAAVRLQGIDTMAFTADGQLAMLRGYWDVSSLLRAAQGA